MLIRGLCQ